MQITASRSTIINNDTVVALLILHVIGRNPPRSSTINPHPSGHPPVTCCLTLDCMFHCLVQSLGFLPTLIPSFPLCLFLLSLSPPHHPNKTSQVRVCLCGYCLQALGAGQGVIKAFKTLETHASKQRNSQISEKYIT